MNQYDRKMRAMERMAGGSVDSQFARGDSIDTNMSASMPTSSPQVSPDTTGANQLSTAGQAGMMTGNPYLMAAGLGLNVMGQAKERELKREAQNINNEIARRDRVMQLMSNLGSGMGRLG